MEMERDEMEEKPIQSVDVEHILPYVGDFDRYQKLLCFVLAATSFPVSMQPVFGYFATLTPEWRCLGNSTECPFNGTLPEKDNSRCDIPRDTWTYTEGKYYSIATQYELHCQKKFLLSLIISIFFAGWGIGAVIIGWIADRYGRKRVIMPCVVTSYVLGLISAFIPSVYALIVFRFFIGFAFPGVLIQVSILITEYVGNEMRPLAKTFPGLAINLAWMIVAMKMYFLCNWKYLSIACNAPYIFVFLFHFFIPESARWLHLNNRPEEAMKILRNIAKWNRKEIPSHITLATSTFITVYKPKSNAILLFKTKSLRLKSLVHIYLWMNIALLGYGLQFAAKNLGGSLYFNFVLLAGMGLPATFFAALINKRFGRKVSTVGSLSVGSVMCLSLALVPHRGSVKMLRVVLGVIGKMGGSMAFFSIYLWVAEMYPTSIRSVAMGVMQVSARVGAAMSPWVIMQLGALGEWIPFVVVGVVSLVGASLGCLLPETKGTVLEDSVPSDVETKGAITGEQVTRK